MINIFILDGDTPDLNRRNWESLLGRPSLGVFESQSELIDAETQQPISRGRCGLVLIHTSYCSEAKLPELSKNYGDLVFLALTASGIINGPRGARYYSVGAGVGKPTDEAFSSRLHEFLEEYEKSGNPDFKLLEPNREYIYALRLLCEAWQQTGGEESASLGGITINAPTRPEMWFRPFDEECSERASTRLSDEMSTVLRDEVQRFLRKIAIGPYVGASNVASLPAFASDVERLIETLKVVGR